MPNDRSAGKGDDAEILAMQQAIQERLRELESPDPAPGISRDRSVLPSPVKPQDLALVRRANPPVAKPQSTPASTATTTAGCGKGCLGLLVLLAFVVALGFPPFWLLFALLVLGFLASS